MNVRKCHAAPISRQPEQELHLRVALAASLLAAALRSCSQPAPVYESQASAFRQSVGVNTHLEYPATPYADADATLRSLQFLGIEHVRDAAFRAGESHASAFSRLAQGGIRFDLFFNSAVDPQIARVHRLVLAYPDGVSTVEGPNEINNEGVAGGRPGDIRWGQVYQKALKVRLRDDRLLRPIPLLAFTTWPPAYAEADASNFHSYPTPTQAIAQRSAWDRRLSSALQPARAPIYCTEAGYTTEGEGSVSEEAQAAFTLISLLENFRAGVVRTYLYELYDGEPKRERVSLNRENHFGLFDHAGGPKPVALALRRLLALLDDRQASAGAVRSSSIKLQGSGVRSLQLLRRDGVRLTILWPADSRSRRQVFEVQAPERASFEVVDLMTGQIGSILSGGRQVLGQAPIAIIQGASASIYLRDIARVAAAKPSVQRSSTPRLPPRVSARPAT